MAVWMTGGGELLMMWVSSLDPFAPGGQELFWDNSDGGVKSTMKPQSNEGPPTSPTPTLKTPSLKPLCQMA